ncbi:hypothetical protein SK128_023967, partial [Halocaridina rubra]
VSSQPLVRSEFNMPSMKPVPALQEICQNWISEALLNALLQISIDLKTRNWKDNFNKTREEKHKSLFDLKEYFKSLIIPLKNILTRKLLAEILNCASQSLIEFLKDFLQCKERSEEFLNIIKNLLSVFSGQGIQELDFSCRESVVYLYNLFLDSSHLQMVLSQTLFMDQLWSSHLVSLKIPDIWNANILKSVALYCQNLLHLDISQERDTYPYDDFPDSPRLSCLVYLYGGGENDTVGCSKLRTLSLPRWSRAKDIYKYAVEMIRYLPDLHVINNIDTQVLAFEYISSVEDAPSLKLTEFESWGIGIHQTNHGDTKHIDMLRYFPDVKRYASFCSVSSVYGFGQRLCDIRHDFPNLEVLEVNKDSPDFFLGFDKFDPLFNIKVFEYFNADMIDMKIIDTISSAFPNLEMLTMSSCYYCDDCWDSLYTSIHFTKLRSLELANVHELDERFLRVILERSPLLDSLKIYNEELEIDMPVKDCVTDNLFEGLKDCLANLKVIKITKGVPTDDRIELTYSSVQTLLSACPNLKYLGDFCYWKISETEFELLEKTI